MGWFKNIMMYLGWTWNIRESFWREKVEEQKKILRDIKAKNKR